MFAIVQAIGWPIWPLIIASIVALALIIERAIALRRVKVLPSALLKDVLSLHSRRQITPEIIVKLEASSPLGRVLAAALRNVRAPRAIAGAAVANAGGHVSHDHPDGGAGPARIADRGLWHLHNLAWRRWTA